MDCCGRKYQHFLYIPADRRKFPQDSGNTEYKPAAINLGLPILYFYLGTGLCIGVGGSVISGRMLGAK